MLLKKHLTRKKKSVRIITLNLMENGKNFEFNGMAIGTNKYAPPYAFIFE